LIGPRDGVLDDREEMVAEGGRFSDRWKAGETPDAAD